MSELRRIAEITEDGELLPPELDVRGDVPAQIVEALETAIAANPNTVVDPVITASLIGDTHLAVFSANFQELPAVDDDGRLLGWMAPYRAEEQLRETLVDELDGVAVEAISSCRWGFYDE